ncbi:serine-enriched protein-like protein [Leptotrombidium deliense]|uniref:Serine-enriched protein-like protein n=2 Tax=Parasitengona TaxID=83141 RepID=A0A443SWM3_9ACAR|nr:serine-enriched protein-like protein [Leptotrombidium deliense]
MLDDEPGDIGEDQSAKPEEEPETAAVPHNSSNFQRSNAIDADECDDLTDHEFETDYSVYENKTGLAEDMKFLASMPELCDITFLIGETREPVCAVRAVLASRSRIFHKLLYGRKQTQNSITSTSSNAYQSGTSSTVEGGSSSASREVESSDVQSSVVRDRPPLKHTKSKKLKDTSKDNKLKLFLKRSSEPVLNGLPFNQQPSVQIHQTMIIEEFEPDVFRQLIEYIHTGCVTLQARTLLGLMNAADYYGLEELRKACMGFVSCCITVDTVCALLASAERYIQYKCTKSLVQRSP